QNSTRSTREVKLGVVHEGWKRKHPSSEEYELRNKSYWYSLGDGENFWELFSRYVYSEYSITEESPVIINGDVAAWISSGVDYYENGVYTKDRDHIKNWINETRRKRSKQEQRKAYLEVDANDQTA